MNRILLCWIIVWAAIFTACAGTQLVADNHRSSHFESTVRHLDLGGTLFLYADIDGDIQRLAGIMDEIIKEVAARDANLDLSSIHMAKLLKILGLDNILAIGLSSYRTKDGYRNHAFILHDGRTDGLMNMFTSKPRAFDIPTWAPADADLIVEKDVNLKAVFDVITTVLKDTHNANAEQVIAHINDPIPGLRVTFRKLIDNFDTRIYGVLRIGEKMISLPNGAFEIPYTQIAMGIDGLGFLFDDLAKTLGANPMFAIKKDKNWETIEINMPLPGDLSIYKPLLAKDADNGRLFIATSKAFLDEFKDGKKVMGKSASFTRAMDGLPALGNGLSFMSGKFRTKLMSYIEKLSIRFSEARYVSNWAEALLPEQAIPVANVSANFADGVYVASNTTSSHKSTLLTAVYANPAIIGVLAAIGIPAFIAYIRKSKLSEVQGQLEKCFRLGVDLVDSGSALNRSLARVCPKQVLTVENLSKKSGLLNYGAARDDYAKLGWINMDASYACYQYEWLNPPKSDGQKVFTCHAWTDLDDDNHAAHHSMSAIWNENSKSFMNMGMQREGDDW